MSVARAQIDQTELSDDKPHPGRRMTEEEFVEWCDPNVWAEWVDGEVITMASAVSIAHALQFGFLHCLVRMYIERHELGIVLCEPVHVRFAGLRRRRAPDILFVAESRRAVLKAQHIEGAPDLIIEIVSPDSERRDRRAKYREYETAGVREYWLTEPMTDDVQAYALGDDGKFRRIEPIDGRIVSTVLPGFYIRPSWLAQSPLPRVADILSELAANP